MNRNIPATMANLKKYGDIKGVVMRSSVTGEQYSASPGDYFMSPPDHVFLDSEGNRMQLVIPGGTYDEFVSADLNAVVDKAMKPDGAGERAYLRKLWDGESWKSIKEKLLTEGSAWVVWYSDGLNAHAANLRKQGLKPFKKKYYKPVASKRSTKSRSGGAGSHASLGTSR